MKHFAVLQRVAGQRLQYLEPLRKTRTASKSLADYLLIKIDGSELELLAHNATNDKFIPVSVVDYVQEVLAFKRLATSTGEEVFFLQTRRGPEVEGVPYVNHLLAFDGHSKQFRIVYEFQSTEQIRVELLHTTKGDVLAQFCARLGSVDLFEVTWINERALGLRRRGEITKGGVAQVVALDRNLLLLLIPGKQVEVWRYSEGVDAFEQRFVFPGLLEPVRVATCSFKKKRLIAVQCAGNVVEVFLLLQGHKSKLYQRLQLQESPLEMRFVQMTSGELMLVVSTENKRRPLVAFRYAGLSKFVERLGYSELEVSARRISELIIGGEDGGEPRNFMIMVAEQGAVILEAITER